MTRRTGILLIGAVNEGVPPRNGEEYKNQVLCGYLRRHHRLVVVDTKDWKRDPLVVPRLLYHFILPDYDSIVVSASSASVHRLFRTLRSLKGRMAKTVYLVIGGYLPKGIGDGVYKADSYAGLSSIVVEGESMRQELLRLSVPAKVIVMPNFKTVGRTWGDPLRFRQKHKRFLFLSRISEKKGIPVIFEALKDPRLSGRKGDFSVDFYGPMEEGYEADFQGLVRSEPNTAYRGYLDINNDPDGSYAVISTYHAMFFLTTWFGEGFPGVIIDTMACGVPVIASDWNMNAEVVENGKNGAVIPVDDIRALADHILDVIENEGRWMAYSEACHRDALEYDAERVLGKHLPVILGLDEK
jgi:glycosyltransferase involved in cell wall biosynthesis